MDNFELIGMPLGEEDELAFEALFTATDLKETVVENAEGRWFAFCDEAGGEVWTGVTHESLFATANPFFSCGSALDIELERVEHGDWPFTAFESVGQIAIKDQGEILTKSIVVGVNIPAACSVAPTGLAAKFLKPDVNVAVATPQSFKAELCILSHVTELFDDADSYTSAQEASGLPMSVPSYLPVGMMQEEGVAQAQGCGMVLKAGEATGVGGGGYCWAHVTGLGGTYGITWHPDECAPAKLGQVLSYNGIVMLRAV